MKHTPITEVDKRALLAMVAMGCDHTVAAQALGWAPAQLAETLGLDPAFAQKVTQAKGQAQFHFVRSLHSATKDEKHWRAATWWLERRAQKQFSRHKSRVWTDAELINFLDCLTEIIVNAVNNEEDRERLLAELGTLAKGTPQTTETNKDREAR